MQHNSSRVSRNDLWLLGKLIQATQWCLQAPLFDAYVVAGMGVYRPVQVLQRHASFAVNM